MEIVFKYAKQKINELERAKPTFQSIFNIIHNQGDRIFAEYIEMFEVKTVSYKQMKEYIYKMATWLSHEIKLPKDSFVGLYMENSVNWIATFWALLMNGYKPLLLNCRLPNDMNNQIIKTMGVKLVIANQSNLKLHTNILQLPDEEVIHRQPSLKKETWANQIAICSTASSLTYKICVYSGENMQHQLLNSEDVIRRCPRIKKHYKHRLKLLAFLPLYHIFGFVATYMWFAAFGRTIVFLNNYSADTILYTVRRCEVTHIFSVPLFWNTIAQAISKQVDRLSNKQQKKFAKAQKFGLVIQDMFPNLGIKISRKMFKEIVISTLGDSIQCLISGGGYIPKSTLYLFNSIGYPLYNGYGATEIGIICVETRKKPKHRIEGSVGKPLNSVYAIIKDNKVIVKGKSTCSYCISRDGKKLTLDGRPFDTNDIGYLDKRHNLYILGRNDDVIVGTNGEKINPDIIEKELTFKYLLKYVVVEVKKQIALVVQIRKNTNILLLQKIYNEIQDNIEHLKKLGYVIEAIYFTYDEISSSQAIKVSRRIFNKLLDKKKITLFEFNKLSELVHKTKKEESDSITIAIKKIFAQVLNKNQKDILNEQHFFLDLGGSSIDYCTCVTRIQDEFNITIDLSNTKCATVNDFAKYIRKQRREHE